MSISFKVDHFSQQKTYSMNTIHSHSYYEIYFLYEGERTVFILNSIVDADVNTLLVIPPNTEHMTSGGPFKRYILNIFPEALNEHYLALLNSISMTPIHLTTKESSDLLELFDFSMKHIYDKSIHFEYRDTIFHAFIFQLLKLNTSTSRQEKNKQFIPPLFCRIASYLTSNYAEKITLNDLTSMFFIQKTALVNNFKKYFNCTPIDYLLQIRLTQSKLLLSQTNLSIEKVSEMCGFSSSNYFGLIFKKKENISPLNFRKTKTTKLIATDL